MAIQDLLCKLEKVKSTGAGRWIACCPAHADKNPSLTIAEKDDGVILIHCWGGCSTVDVIGAVGLEFDALFPPKTDAHNAKPIKKPWHPADVLAVMAHESTVAVLIIQRVRRGELLDYAEHERLLQARNRLMLASEAVNG